MNTFIKKTGILFFTLLVCLTINAKERVRVVLHNGKVMTGEKIHAFSYGNCFTVDFKDDVTGQKMEFSTEEVDTIVCCEDQECSVYVPHKAESKLPNLWQKHPKLFKKPVFMGIAYEGRHVSGYWRSVRKSSFSEANGREVSTETVFYYKMNGEDIARVFWVGYGGAVKAVQKLIFRDYPILTDTIENLNTKEFLNDPFSFIRTFDELLDKQ